MRYLKKYENWFTNIFKSDGSDTEQWEDFVSQSISNIKNKGIAKNHLMNAAREGNLKKFKRVFPRYINKLNDIYTDYTDTDDGETSTVLLDVTGTSNGDIPDKKKMIKMLIENGADPLFINTSGYSFYDYIQEPKLKKWVDETYPEIVNQLEMIKNSKKYNI